MGGLLGQIFGALSGANRADRIRQENYEFHKNRTLLDAALKGEAPPEYGDAAIEAMAKMGGKHGKEFIEILNNMRTQQERQQPKLQVPQLTPPPEQNASFGPTAGGGIPMPPPPPGMVAGPPLPEPTPGQMPQPVVNGPMGGPRLYSPSERGQAQGEMEAAKVTAGARMNEQVIDLRLRRLTSLGIDPRKDLDPQQLSKYLATGEIPYAPLHPVSEGTNLVGPTGNVVATGQPRQTLIPPGNWLKVGDRIMQGPGQVVSTAPGSQTNIVSQPPPQGGFSAPPPPPGMAAPGPTVTPVADVPPLPPPEIRTAWSAYAQMIGKKVDQLSPEEKAKGVAWWNEMSDPLGTATKRSTLSTQAMNRAIMQNELDLANDPETIEMAATRYRMTGNMPQLGMRSTLVRAAILRTAARQSKEAGETSEQAAANPAVFKAQQSALADIVKRKNQIASFEKTATKNLDVFLREAQKIVDAKSPVLNQVFRGGQRTLTGGLEGFDAARITAFTEVSRVLSGTMGAQLSDSARHEAESIINSNYTIPGLIRAVNVLKTDMQNRMTSFDEQEAEIKRAMGIAAPKEPPPPPGTVVVSYNGKNYQFPNQQAADGFKREMGIR